MYKKHKPHYASTPKRKRQKTSHEHAKHAGHHLSHRDVVIRSPTTGESNSRAVLKYKRGKNPLLKYVTEPTKIHCNYISQATWATNSQVMFDIFAAFRGGSTPSGTTNCSLNVAQLWGTSNQDAANAATTKGLIGSNDTGRKMLLKSADFSTVFTNDTPMDCMIEIYDCIPKHTFDANRQSNSYPYLMWNDAIFTDRDNQSTATITQYGRKPTDHKIWNESWTVVKKTIVELAGARSHIHKFYFKPNTVIDTSYFNDFNVVKGLSYHCMVVVKGIDQVSAKTALGTNIGVAPGLVYYRCDAEYTVAAVNCPPRKVFYYDNVATNALIANTAALNQQTGTVQNPEVVG